MDQVTDVINGKRILGAQDEICEVKNAFEAYNRLLELNPYSIKDMLLAHKVLMNELTKEAGVFAGKHYCCINGSPCLAGYR